MAGKVEIEGKNVSERLLEFLKDGQYHNKIELAEAVGCEVTMVAFHVCMARKMLPDGQEIICVFVRRATGYRRVILYQTNEFENLDVEFG